MLRAELGRARIATEALNMMWDAMSIKLRAICDMVEPYRRCTDDAQNLVCEQGLR